MNSVIGLSADWLWVYNPPNQSTYSRNWSDPTNWEKRNQNVSGTYPNAQDVSVFIPGKQGGLNIVIDVDVTVGKLIINASTKADNNAQDVRFTGTKKFTFSVSSGRALLSVNGINSGISSSPLWGVAVTYPRFECPVYLESDLEVLSRTGGQSSNGFMHRNGQLYNQGHDIYCYGAGNNVIRFESSQPLSGGRLYLLTGAVAEITQSCDALGGSSGPTVVMNSAIATTMQVRFTMPLPYPTGYLDHFDNNWDLGSEASLYTVTGGINLIQTTPLGYPPVNFPTQNVGYFKVYLNGAWTGSATSNATLTSSTGKTIYFNPNSVGCMQGPWKDEHGFFLNGNMSALTYNSTWDNNSRGVVIHSAGVGTVKIAAGCTLPNMFTLRLGPRTRTSNANLQGDCGFLISSPRNIAPSRTEADIFNIASGVPTIQYVPRTGTSYTTNDVSEWAGILKLNWSNATSSGNYRCPWIFYNAGSSICKYTGFFSSPSTAAAVFQPIYKTGTGTTIFSGSTANQQEPPIYGVVEGELQVNNTITTTTPSKVVVGVRRYVLTAPSYPAAATTYTCTVNGVSGTATVADYVTNNTQAIYTKPYALREIAWTLHRFSSVAWSWLDQLNFNGTNSNFTPAECLDIEVISYDENPLTIDVKQATPSVGSSFTVVESNLVSKLTGTGTINAPVTIYNNASCSIEPGNSTSPYGTLTVSSLAAGANSILKFAVSGASNSKIAINGAYTAQGKFVVTGTLQAGTYDLVTCTGTLTAGTKSLDVSGATGFSSAVLSISVASKKVQLVVT